MNVSGKNIIFVPNFTSVDFFAQLYHNLTVNYGTYGLLLLVAIVLLFFVQLYYYAGPYGRIPGFRNGRHATHRREPGGISVIVLLHDNLWYLENTLPKLLAQQYDRFEVVIVEVGATEEFSDRLAILREHCANLVTTKMEQDPRFPISNKMAYNLGIKAAHYENIILTTSDAEPISAKWLTCMAKGFATGDVVIGYCGIEPTPGLANRMMRCSRLMQGVRYLSAAIHGTPYRGTIQNLGFTKELYFSHKGFNYLNMNVGEDDLFIQMIARPENCSIVMNPHATVRQKTWGGITWWRNQRRFFSATYRYYPLRAKTTIEWELGSRLLYLLTTVTAVICLPLEIKIGAGTLWLLRAFLVRFQLWRIRRRLGEPRLGWALMLHDLISPFDEIMLALVRRFKPIAGVWR